MVMTKREGCLGNGYGKHHWKYRQDSMLGRLRECQACGRLEQQQGKRYVQIGSTRWKP